MKKPKSFLSNPFVVLLVILMISIIVLCIPYILFDMIRYYRTPYYKDFKKKYKHVTTSAATIKLYNRVKRKKLPLSFEQNGDAEYFIKDGTVMVVDLGRAFFTEVDGEWFFCEHGKYEAGTRRRVKDFLKKYSNGLKEEHQALPIKILIFRSNVKKKERWNKYKGCPYFACYESRQFT